MNLIEAVKSGRPFKRKGHTAWHDLSAGGYVCWDDKGKWAVVHMHGADVIADDWELKEPTATITRNQFWTAVHGSSSSQLGQELRLDYAGIESLARKLGLEPA